MTEILQNPIVPRQAGPAEGGAVSPGAKDGIEQAWLRELERAQLQQQRGETSRGAAAPDAKDQGAAEQRDAPQPAVRPRTTQSWVASRAPARPAAGSFDTVATRVGTDDRLPGARAAQSPPPGRTADTAPPQKPALAFEAEIACRLWGEPRKWEPRRVHARTRDGKVWIWIRDAEFEASETARLTASLARLAREAGAELEGITVNGHVVFGPTPSDDPTRSI